MNKKFLKLTYKVESEIIIILEKLINTTQELNVKCFVVGAIARDIIFTNCYNIQTGRATSDIDLGVNLVSWDHYNTFTKKLCSDAKFAPTKVIHRLEYDKYPVDIIPFGKISDRAKKILWPPDQTNEMNLLGFEEAFLDSVIVRLREDPILDIPIVSPLGFALLKFFSWADRNDEIKDAHDLRLVISNYADLGNQERILEVDEILKQEDFDYQMAGAMLLGYDIASVASDKTIDKIIEILENETGKDGSFKLVERMLIVDPNSKFDFNLKLLQSLQKGIMIR
jgi:predicted nucleotidyltransferase